MLPLLSGFEDINIKYLDTESINSQSIIETNILLIRSQTIVDESLLSKSKISWIGSATAGIDHIDTHYLEKKISTGLMQQAVILHQYVAMFYHVFMFYQSMQILIKAILLEYLAMEILEKDLKQY